MFYKFHLLRENLIVHDEYYFSEIEPPRGKNCFLIVQHTKRKRSIEQVLTKLLDQGYTYFYFWGEHAFSWKSNLEKLLKNKKVNNKDECANRIRYEAHTYDLIYFVYNLADMVATGPENMNLLASDDYGFTEMAIDHFESIMNDELALSLGYWQLFRNGYELNINGMDIVISFRNGDIILDSISKCRIFWDVRRALEEKIFDGLGLEDFIRIDEREESVDEEWEESMGDEWEEAIGEDFG